jgi:GAF domain-containing protein
MDGRLEQQVLEILVRSADRETAIREVVQALSEWGALYDWTGVYLLEGGELVIAHEVGSPTPHRRIALDKGICGAAAREGRTIVVDDVNADPRYLACTLATRSEIVVPIGRGGRVLGEIDVDSDSPAAFTDADRTALERIAEMLFDYLDEPSTGTRAGEGRAPRAGARLGGNA